MWGESGIKWLFNSSTRTLSTASYKQQLYAARKFKVTESVSNAFHQFNTAIRTARIRDEVNARRQFVRPGQVANLERMASRRRRFNAMFAGRVTEVQRIHEQYYTK